MRRQPERAAEDGLRPRVCILHQGFVPLYRAPMYERLARSGQGTFVVVHGQAPRGTGHIAAEGPFGFPNLFRRSRELRLGRRCLIWQPVLRSVLRGDFDAAVVGHEFKLVTNLLLFALFKARGRPVLLWGHGYHRDTAHWLARHASALAARLADGYLAYTEGGKQRLVDCGVPADRIVVVHNTIDMADQIAARERLGGAEPAALRRELGLDPEATVLLYIGRLYARKRCGDLPAILDRLEAHPAAPPVELVIVGDGPERTSLQQAMAGRTNVRFLGTVHDPDRLARLMRVAAAMVNPGSAGLAVNHCFAHGLPVVVRSDMQHSPEIDYVRHGENGLIVDGDLDDFADALAGLLGDAGLQARLRTGALATGADLGLDRMVEAFGTGVRTTLVRRRSGTPGSRRADPIDGARPTGVR